MTSSKETINTHAREFTMELKDQSIPEEVLEIGSDLEQAGYRAYLVGGCVRDIALGRSPNDWDIATDAKPDEVQKLFPESVYENKEGTVAIKTGSEEEALRLVEVTTFRVEGEYSDRRHPDKVEFVDSIEEDLARRDFTVNAMAGDIGTISEGEMEVVDPFGGQADLKEKLIRAVGDPDKRFSEDALRMLRAVRFAVYLSDLEQGEPDWQIEKKTAEAIQKNRELLKEIAQERIRDELVKMLNCPHAAEGIRTLEEVGLLEHTMPELREGIGEEQNHHHIYTVFKHNVRALDYAAKNDYPLHIRLSSLLHDVGKPRTKRGGDDGQATFYGHEVVGARMAKRILKRLRFPKEIVNQVRHLVRNHMFNYEIYEETEEGDIKGVTEAGVRRLLKRVGPENIDDLIKLREADRIGSGVPKAVPYRLRHLLFMIEKVKRDPLSVKMLEVDGEDVMEMASIEPSWKVGAILNLLLEDVLDSPARNDRNYLETKIKEYAALPDEELRSRANAARQTKEKEEEKEVKKLKREFRVK